MENKKKHGNISKFFNIKRNKWLLNIIVCFISTEEKIRFLTVNRLFQQTISESEEFLVTKNIIQNFNNYQNINIFSILSRNSRILDKLVKSKISEINLMRSFNITGLKVSTIQCKEEIERIIYVLIGRKLENHVILQDFFSVKPENSLYRLHQNCVNYDSLYMRSIGVSYLTKSLLHFSNLQILNLRKNLIGPLGVENICCLIEKNKTIIYLDLSDNIIGTMGTFSLCNLVKKRTCQLQVLNIDQNIIKDNSLLYLLECLKDNIHLKNLTFSLGNFAYDKTFYKRLGKLLHINTNVAVNITCIEQMSNINDSHIITILSEPLLKNIKFNLNVKYNTRNRSKKRLIFLQREMKIKGLNYSYYSMSSFKAYRNMLTDDYEIISLVFDMNSKIDETKCNLNNFEFESLSLSSNSFDNYNKSFFKTLKKSKIIKKLSCDSLEFNGETLEYFTDALINNKSITNLYLKNCVGYLYKIMLYNKSIKKLFIEGSCSITNIVKSLEYNNTLEVLIFKLVDFCNKDFKILVKVLTINKMIKYLFIDSGRLNSIKGIHIKNLLKKTSLEWICFKHCNFNHKARFIAKGIKTSKYLKRLTLNSGVRDNDIINSLVYNNKIDFVDFYQNYNDNDNCPKIKINLQRED